MSKFSPASNAYSRPKCVWEAAVDVIVNALYQKATINLLPPCSHDAYSNASSTALHPLISFKRQNVGQRRRFWRSGAERRITLQLLKKLASIFQGAVWEDPTFERLVTYRFCFTLRLFLVENDEEFRIAACRVFRYVLLSDRILQLCCDLFIPEFVAMCLDRSVLLAPTDLTFNTLTESLEKKWNFEERVASLKLIRKWCDLTTKKLTVVPIPTCYFRVLVAVATSEESTFCGMTKKKQFDPLRFLCLDLLKDLAVCLKGLLFQRLAQAGGISVLFDSVADGVLYGAAPQFCKKLAVVISQVLDDRQKRRLIFETSTRLLKTGACERLLPVTLIFYRITDADPWESWWFWELASFCSSLVNALLNSSSGQIYDGFSRGRFIFQTAAQRRLKVYKKELAPLHHSSRLLGWNAVSSAFLVLCQTFAGLFAVAAHPYGLRSLVQLLWSPLEPKAQLDLVMLFMRLILLGLNLDGRPIKSHYDLFCLAFTRTLQNFSNLSVEPQTSDTLNSRPRQDQTVGHSTPYYKDAVPGCSDQNSTAYDWQNQSLRTASKQFFPQKHSSQVKLQQQNSILGKPFERPILSGWLASAFSEGSELIGQQSKLERTEPIPCQPDSEKINCSQLINDDNRTWCCEETYDNCSLLCSMNSQKDLDISLWEVEKNQTAWHPQKNVSSLSALNYPDCLGFMPLESAVASGFERGACLNLRDIFGLFIFRVCLREGLHIALASIVVTVQNTNFYWNCLNRLNTTPGCAFQASQDFTQKELNSIAAMLLARSAQLLSILLWFSSCLGPKVSYVMNYLLKTSLIDQEKIISASLLISPYVDGGNLTKELNSSTHQTADSISKLRKNYTAPKFKATLLDLEMLKHSKTPETKRHDLAVSLERCNVLASGTTSALYSLNPFKDQQDIAGATQKQQLNDGFGESFRGCRVKTDCGKNHRNLVRNIAQCVSFDMTKKKPTQAKLLTISSRLSRALNPLFKGVLTENSVVNGFESVYENISSNRTSNVFQKHNTNVLNALMERRLSLGRLQQLLAYSKYHSGPIAHAVSYNDIRVLRIAQFSMPLHFTDGNFSTSPCEAVYNCIRKTGVIPAVLQKDFLNQPFQNANFDVSQIELNSAEWDWRAIFEVLSGLSQQYIHQFTATSCARDFLTRLVYFFLPSQLKFAIEPWNSRRLNLVACGVNLVLLLCILDEPADIPSHPCAAVKTHPACDSCYGSVSCCPSDCRGVCREKHQFLVELRQRLVAEIVTMLRLELAASYQILTNKSETVLSSRQKSTMDPSAQNVFPYFLFRSFKTGTPRCDADIENCHELNLQPLIYVDTLITGSDPYGQEKEETDQTRHSAINYPAIHLDQTLQHGATSNSVLLNVDFVQVACALDSAYVAQQVKDFPRSHTEQLKIDVFVTLDESAEKEGEKKGRLFSENAMHFFLAREYATLVGAMSATRRGVKLLLDNYFFRVLSELILIGERNSLVLLFLKQLNMSYFPCRNVVEMAVLFGSQTLRLHILHHFTLICEGGGISTPCSKEPTAYITCSYSKNAFKNKKLERFTSVKKSPSFHSDFSENERTPPIQSTTVLNGTSLSYAFDEGLPHNDANDLTPGQHPSALRCYPFGSCSPFRMPRNPCKPSVNGCNRVSLFPRTYRQRQKHSFKKCGTKTLQSEKDSLNRLVALDPLWCWILRWSVRLVFSIEPVRNVSTAFLLMQRGQRKRHKKITAKQDSCFVSKIYLGPVTIPFYRCFASSFVAKTALNLVTQLCRQDCNSTIMDDVLMSYLPSAANVIRTAPIHRINCNCSFEHELCPNHFPRILYSDLSDWPFALKTHLLRSERGTRYLIKTKWLGKQLSTFMETLKLTDFPQPDNETSSQRRHLSSCEQKHISRELGKHSTNQSWTSKGSWSPYISIIDALLLTTIWDASEDATGGSQIVGNMCLTESVCSADNTSNAPFVVVPDPYRYHFYCSSGLCRDLVYPFSSSGLCKHRSSKVTLNGSDLDPDPYGDTHDGAASSMEDLLTLNDETSLSFSVWPTRKRSIQSRHQRSPYEFLSHLPFWIVVQSGDAANEPDNTDANPCFFDASISRCLPPTLAQTLWECVGRNTSQAGPCNTEAGTEDPHFDSHYLEPLFLSFGEQHPLLDVPQAFHFIDMNSNASSFRLCAYPELPISNTKRHLKATLMVGTFFVTRTGNLTDDVGKALWSHVDVARDVLGIDANKYGNSCCSGNAGFPNTSKNDVGCSNGFSYKTVVRSAVQWTFRLLTHEKRLREIVLMRMCLQLELMEPSSLSVLQSKISDSAIKNHETLSWRCSPSSSAKPPATLLTYLAFTQTGLEFLDSLGYIDLLERQLDYLIEVDAREHSLRNVIWNIGHLVSSELGVLYLSQRRNLLQRLINIGFWIPRGAIRGTILYALGLVPTTHTTLKIFQSIGWDLTARGPTDARLAEYFTTSVSPSCQQSKNCLFSAQKHCQQSNEKSSPNKDVDASTSFSMNAQRPKSYNKETEQSSTTCKSLDDPEHMFLASSVSNHFQKYSSDQITWRLGRPVRGLIANGTTELPANVVAGFDLSQLIFKTPFATRNIASFGLYWSQNSKQLGSRLPVLKANKIPYQFYSCLFEEPCALSSVRQDTCVVEVCVSLHHIVFVPWTRTLLEKPGVKLDENCDQQTFETGAPQIKLDVATPTLPYAYSLTAFKQPSRHFPVAARRVYDYTSKTPSRGAEPDAQRMAIQPSTSYSTDSLTIDFAENTDEAFFRTPKAFTRKNSACKYKFQPKQMSGNSGNALGLPLSVGQTEENITNINAPDLRDKQRSADASGVKRCPLFDNGGDYQKRNGQRFVSTWSNRLCDIIMARRASEGCFGVPFITRHQCFYPQEAKIQPCFDESSKMNKVELLSQNDVHSVMKESPNDGKESGKLIERDYSSGSVSDVAQEHQITHCEQEGITEPGGNGSGAERQTLWPQISDLLSSDVSEAFDVISARFHNTQERRRFSSAWSTAVDSRHGIRNADSEVEGSRKSTVHSLKTAPLKVDVESKHQTNSPEQRRRARKLKTFDAWNVLAGKLIDYLTHSDELLLQPTCHSHVFTEDHQTLLKEISQLINTLTAQTSDILTSLRQKRNAQPYLFLSVELWWRVQMLFRLSTVSREHRSLIMSFFNDTFQSLEAWFYLDLITQYVKWQCTIPLSENSVDDSR